MNLLLAPKLSDIGGLSYFHVAWPLYQFHAIWCQMIFYLGILMLWFMGHYFFFFLMASFVLPVLVS